jgi:hypothetical protein
MDERDSFWNGALTGIAFPILGYAFWHVVGLALAATVIPDWGGFTLKFKVMIGIATNFIPFQIFIRQRRDYALRGIISITFVLIFSGMWYFREQLGIFGYGSQ